MKTISTQAIILKRINYGEADRIITVITPDQGKVSILAKGVRRSKSKLAGGLELFSVSNISYIDGKSDLKTVVSTQLVHHFGEIVKNVQTTMMAYDFLKSIDQHTQDSCEGEFFSLLESGLGALHVHSKELEIVVVWFCNRLLQLTGHGLNTATQIDGKIFDEEKRYQFSYDHMGFFERPNGQWLPKHIKFLRLLDKVTTPANLLQIADAKQLAKELIGLTTYALNTHT